MPPITAGPSSRLAAYPPVRPDTSSPHVPSFSSWRQGWIFALATRHLSLLSAYAGRKIVAALHLREKEVYRQG